MTAAPLPVDAEAASTNPLRAQARAAPFAIGEQDFLLSGRPFRILSGAIHYFRIHPDQWADRIRKARQMGLNTVETYVAWNAHSRRAGAYDFTGGLDLGRFLDLVAAEGMQAIVRPGPYICAEWNNGGLPAWLFSSAQVGVRRDEPIYMAAVGDYFEQLGPILAPRQITAGGPIILVQIENEYGAYGADKTYLRRLVELNRQVGIDVPLITVDQPVEQMLANGSLPELHKTASFGSRVAERLATLRRHQPSGPLMCSEFWNGWFDYWGDRHRTSTAQTTTDLEELLARGASVNIYMFHGGTNFGFTNGANDKGSYQPIITSYDYDAPLDEAGNPTPKYWAFRDILAQYSTPDPQLGAPEPAPPAPQFSTPLEQSASLWQVVDRTARWQSYEQVPTAESVGQYDGFTLYRTSIELTGPGVLQIGEVRDRAQVFVNRDSVGILARDHHDRSITLPADARGTLELLVENQGRVNYGPRLGEPKGLIAPTAINGEPLRHWQASPLPLEDLTAVQEALDHSGLDQSRLDRSGAAGAGLGALAEPVFARAYFDLAAASDLYLDTSGWGKGVAWINGFCLGRYWSRGPQRTLYVPGPVLRTIGNELIVLELHATATAEARFVSAPNLGHTEP